MPGRQPARPQMPVPGDPSGRQTALLRGPWPPPAPKGLRPLPGWPCRPVIIVSFVVWPAKPRLGPACVGWLSHRSRLRPLRRFYGSCCRYSSPAVWNSCAGVCGSGPPPVPDSRSNSSFRLRLFAFVSAPAGTGSASRVGFEVLLPRRRATGRARLLLGKPGCSRT